MNPSTRKSTPDRALICARPGELPEFEALLATLGVTAEHHEGDLPNLDQLESVRLVIVPGTRLTDGRAPSVHRWPRTIAVVDDTSRTLAAHLARIGVGMIVRRPIHPRALRLLLLHVLYRGPERRIKKRVLIGHPIRAGAGLFKHDATLLELSRTGARISLPNPPKVGTTMQLVLGKELTNSKPIKIVAKVVRSVRAAAAGREDEIGLALQGGGDLDRSIQAILDRFASGPASVGNAARAPQDLRSPRPAAAPPTAAAPALVRPASTPDSAASSPTSRGGAPVPLTTRPRPEPPTSAARAVPAAPTARILPPSYQPDPMQGPVRDTLADPTLESTLEASPDPASDLATFDVAAEEAELELEYDLDSDLDGELEFDDADGGPDTADMDEEPDGASVRDGESRADDPAENAQGAERRRSRRVPYPQRVVALGQEAARVVVGRDLCFGGMRIAANPALAVGDVLRIALHAGSETEPLVVLAGVERDDGDDGLVLAFAQLTSGQRARLEKILAASSPIQAPGPEAEEDDSLVVGELLARVARGRTEEPV